MNDDRRYLRMAARVALRASGHTEPNPAVGCVLVSAGRVIGIGHHLRFGGLHAEREALANARSRGEDPRGCTAYVTLEPCNHTGKQPPCTEALLEAGVSRVVASRSDPGEASGGGFARLRAEGVACEVAASDALPLRPADPFVKVVRTGLPWVIAKWAQTLDGRVATRTGASEWISNERSRARVHRWRSRVDAVLVGVGTVLADDPMLTARGVRRVRRLARRVVLDREFRTPPDGALARTAREVPTLVVGADWALGSPAAGALRAQGVEVWGGPELGGGLDARAVLTRLASEHNATNVLVESGPTLMGALFEEELIDEALVYVAPTVMGDDEARSAVGGREVPELNGLRRLVLQRAKRLGEDLELWYRRSEG